MKQYLELSQKALAQGIRKSNRTGVDHIGYTGDMMKFNLTDGFPAVTTKRLAFKSVVAEMLGFLRGYSNAADFRALGCKVWNANANENQHWLDNSARSGADDLGRIYGVQARQWAGNNGAVDQLRNVYNDLRQGVDNRREIVTHWNPGEMSQMALPPCHMFYQFGIQGDRLNLSMYQRSCDVPLGIPFNIAGYAWLLCVMARITGHQPGEFTHFMHDIHIYENQIEPMQEQLSRDPLPLPVLWMNPEIGSLEDLETWVTPDDFHLEGYQHHPAIAFPFSV
jgi:thymidylate synthase